MLEPACHYRRSLEQLSLLGRCHPGTHSLKALQFTEEPCDLDNLDTRLAGYLFHIRKQVTHRLNDQVTIQFGSARSAYTL